MEMFAGYDTTTDPDNPSAVCVLCGCDDYGPLLRCDEEFPVSVELGNDFQLKCSVCKIIIPVKITTT